MILFAILAMILVPAFLIALVVSPIIAWAEYKVAEIEEAEFEESEDKAISAHLGDDELMVCPKCENIREGIECSKCKVALVTMDKYEQTW